ncbi:MAG TPA: ABC transporter permease [Acidimicrobiales bacterium]|jgi:putative ABC transport system permease protein|nr:ABC transporter permease [Acidimicrobiales bacterium]
MRRLLRGALAHTTRLLGTALAVALAVTLVSGTFILTDTVDSAFHAASADTANSSDLIVRSTALFAAQATSLPEREPVPESLVASIAAVPGVKAVWTAVQGYAELVDKQGHAIAPKGLPTIGGSWAPTDTLVAGKAPTGPGEVAIDADTARQYGLQLGDTIKVLFSGSAQDFTIGGLLRKAGDVIASTKAIFDAATAQKVLGVEGQVDAIPVEAAPGVSATALRARINAVLPGRYEAVTSAQVARESAQSWTKAVGFLPTGLLLFAAVALLVGAFIICNTFSILVSQRARELGLLRAIGASRSQLTVSVLFEAVAVGLVGSLTGVVLGFGAARGLLALLHGVGMQLPAAPTVFRLRTALIGVVVGVVVTVVAAVPPALRATRVAPIGAIRGLENTSARSTRGRLVLGAATAAVGLVTLLTGVLGGLSRPVGVIGAGAVGLVAGLAVLIPLIARPAARLLGAPLIRVFGEPAFLGRENAMRSPRRTASTAAALMIGIGLIGVVTILAASMKASATRTVDDSLRADFVVAPSGTAGGAGGVPPVVIDRLRTTAGVAGVSEILGGQWGLDGSPQTLLAVDPATVTTMHEVDARSAQAVHRLDDAGVLVRDTTAERYGWKVGDSVPMTFARTGVKRMAIEGTFSSNAVRTDYVISLGAYAANYAQQLALEVDVALAPGLTPATGRAPVEAALADYPVVKVMDRAQVLAAQRQQVDRLLVPVTALLALSVVIALLGIANTLALSIHERTRELGLLRAIGMARGQLRSMIRSEAAIIACMGAGLGLGIALFFGWALVASMRHLGVSELVLPLPQLLGLAALATGAGMVAGMLPARRAASLRVLDAISSER